MGHDTDDWQAAARLLDVGIELLAGQSDPPLILGMLYCLRAECDVFNGDAPSGVARSQAGLDIAARSPGSWGHAFCLWNAAFAKQTVGEVDTAITLLTQMIAICVKGGYGIAEVVGSNSLGEIFEERQDLEQARALFERVYQLRQDLGGLRTGYVHGSLSSSMLALGRVAAKQGDFATASPLLADALPLAQAMRDSALTSQIEALICSLAEASAPAR